MPITASQLHDLIFLLLYLAVAIVTFVVIERLVSYALLELSRGRIRGAVTAGSAITGNDVLSRSLRRYGELQIGPVTRGRLEDVSAALFLEVDGKLHARLWLLDTVVTAAPLLGLLGTIMGIMQTFRALSAGGISDPTAVSRGIGTALTATAVGIGVALYGLLGHNLLNRVAEHLAESFKTFLLETTKE